MTWAALGIGGGVAIAAVVMAIIALRKVSRSIKRAEKYLDLAERQGNITERQQGAVGRVIGEASVRADQIAKVAQETTSEKAADLKDFMLGKINELRSEMDNRFEHMDEEFSALKNLIGRLVDPQGVGR